MNFFTKKAALAALLLVFSTAIFAQFGTLSVQGTLKKTNDQAVDDGPYDLTFRLYDVASGGTALWSETQTGLLVTGGIYSAQIGSVTPFGALAFDVPYFLGVTVNGKEMSPRTQLSAAPYALAILGTAPAYFGDVKSSFQPNDHVGWVKLDGRLKSTLTANQQARATALGIGTNLPNDDNRGIVGVSSTKALGATGGAETVTLAQNNLPNTPLQCNSYNAVFNGGNISSDSNTSGNTGIPAWENAGNGIQGWPSSTLTNMFPNSSINGAQTQVATNITNPYLALNLFIYLGL